ncbi:aldehyde dehydrogenase family protein [Paracoccus sanguinis]|uniref:aldehyde dehydrogenase family protein n=1 Tax=Paracoccus sanguinis TaxID=1545044 RepID=UPI0014526208|nr:aldehyde dehydrogenase family protein [Paracoccus sanguinis]QJD17364.1 aldehyde dehydrogenase family protein [Paracoccus sanguinis]
MNITELLTTMEYGPNPEAADEAQAWLDARTDWPGHFIGGAFRPDPGAPLIAVENPATRAVLARMPQASAETVDAAVAAARDALPGWQALGPQGRARVLYALARHLQQRARFLAVLETMDNGKPIRESRDIDLPLAARHFYHHAGWAAALEAEFPGAAPWGVCAQVIPWNFPLLMLAWKIAPALAAGNTVVLKPAEQTPLTALAFAELCTEAGVPAGVVNIVFGAGETGAALVAHAGVDKVAFTGSTEVGRAIRRATAGSGKGLTLELGGKSPFVICADADLEAAVEGVVDGIWFNGGQVCCAGSRLLVQEGIAERFHARLRDRLARLRVGDPLDKSTDIGAIVSAEQLDRIAGLVASGQAQGGTLHRADAPLPETGHFCAPGFFTGSEAASRVAREEIFGPIAVSMTFRTPDEAVELANNTAYGLAASIWSESLTTALDLAARIRAGVVWVNGTNLLDAAAPFGGMKESGFGREGGRAGLAGYLRPAGDAAPTAGAPVEAPAVDFATPTAGTPAADEGIDRTLKLYVGGKQVRPDGGGSYAVTDGQGRLVTLAARANRKDVRNAVEAAVKAGAWARMTGHGRAQVLYFWAENMDQRRAGLADSLTRAGLSAEAAAAEVSASIDALILAAGLADKIGGEVAQVAQDRMVALAMREPWGTVGLVCGEAAPLSGLVAAAGALMAAGNRVVAIPAPRHARAAGDLAQILATSDVPGGALNLLTGDPAELAPALASHDEVDALWLADSRLRKVAETAAAGNLKPVVVGTPTPDAPGVRRMLDAATQRKTVWIPYGA